MTPLEARAEHKSSARKFCYIPSSDDDSIVVTGISRIWRRYPIPPTETDDPLRATYVEARWKDLHEHR